MFEHCLVQTLLTKVTGAALGRDRMAKRTMAQTASQIRSLGERIGDWPSLPVVSAVETPSPSPSPSRLGWSLVTAF